MNPSSGFGVKLPLDIGVEAHFLDRFNVAGAGAEADAVEDVDDFGPVGSRFLDRVRSGREQQEKRSERKERKTERVHQGSRRGNCLKVTDF